MASGVVISPSATRFTNACIPSDWLSSFGENVPEHMMLCRRALADKLDDWKLAATPSPVEGFVLGVTPLTREQAGTAIGAEKAKDANASGTCQGKLRP